MYTRPDVPSVCEVTDFGAPIAMRDRCVVSSLGALQSIEEPNSSPVDWPTTLRAGDIAVDGAAAAEGEPTRRIVAAMSVLHRPLIEGRTAIGDHRSALLCGKGTSRKPVKMWRRGSESSSASIFQYCAEGSANLLKSKNRFIKERFAQFRTDANRRAGGM